MTTDLRAAIEALPDKGFAANRPTGPRTQDGHALASRLRARDPEVDWDAWVRSIEEQTVTLLDAAPAPGLDVERARLRDELCACEPHFTGEAGHPPVVDYIVPEWLAQRIMAALAPSQPEPDL